MKELDFDKESEKALENWLLQKYDPINWEMGYSCELEDLPAIIPLIEIKDNSGKGRTFMFGNDIHDTLVVETANNRSGIYYLNLQNSCSSRFCDEGYEIVDNGNIKKEEFIYIHFQKRQLQIKSIGKSFYILGDMVVDKMAEGIPLLGDINKYSNFVSSRIDRMQIGMFKINKICKFFIL